jgi:tRNA threonylcarbamoyl adenosine modification protein YeaZ
VLAALELEDRRRHAELLVDRTHRALRAATLDWRSLDLLAVDVGPGSFTGIRVGVSFVLGMSESLAIPAAGVGSLDILARACYDATSPGTGAYIIPAADVRRGEVARSRFRVTGRGPIREEEDHLLLLDEPGPPPPADSWLAGDGASLLWPGETGLRRWEGTGALRAVAAARLAGESYRAGRHEAPVPRYARPADARPRRS